MTKTRKLNRRKKITCKKTFSNKDYLSGDGMVTSIWGPPLWHYLHTMSFNYPNHPTNEEKKHYMNFILNLKYVLPCKHCRMNLRTNFKQLPLTKKDMKNRDTFSRYVYELHELINKMLNKKSNLSYCMVRERYEHFRARCTTNKPKIFKYKKYTRKNKEKGCTEPLYGKKSKCIINIVPEELKGESIQIDKKCIKTREPI
jgi:hypothetical protein